MEYAFRTLWKGKGIIPCLYNWATFPFVFAKSHKTRLLGTYNIYFNLYFSLFTY